MKVAEEVPLEGASPFELRVELSKSVSESVVKKALETGDLGFLHSFTTGSAVDGPGMRVVAWTAGCQYRCLYCHNPDTWNMMNGMAVTLERAIAVLNIYRHGLKVMNGGLTLSGGEPLMQDRFVVRLLTRRSIRTDTLVNACQMTNSSRSTSCCSISKRGIANVINA
jgi:pyruvate formate lyase activating enzyme